VNAATTNEAATRPALFEAGRFRCVELAAQDMPALQTFFETNAEYFHSVNGAPPGPDEALNELEDAPPPELSFTRKWLLGFLDETGRIHGMANVLADFLAVGVFHIGLFIVASPFHGTGVPRSMYDALERWLAARGAAWLRLGVVKGNAKAERFWTKVGYGEVRERAGITMGARVNTVRVLVKPLGSERRIARYLALVARDRPDSP